MFAGETLAKLFISESTVSSPNGSESGISSLHGSAIDVTECWYTSAERLPNVGSSGQPLSLTPLLVGSMRKWRTNSLDMSSVGIKDMFVSGMNNVFAIVLTCLCLDIRRQSCHFERQTKSAGEWMAVAHHKTAARLVFQHIDGWRMTALIVCSTHRRTHLLLCWCLVYTNSRTCLSQRPGVV